MRSGGSKQLSKPTLIKQKLKKSRRRERRRERLSKLCHQKQQEPRSKGRHRNLKPDQHCEQKLMKALLSKKASQTPRLARTSRPRKTTYRNQI
jgi:hypothetical protein